MRRNLDQLERRLPHFFGGASALYRLTPRLESCLCDSLLVALDRDMAMEAEHPTKQSDRLRNAAPSSSERLSNISKSSKLWLSGACALEREMFEAVGAAFDNDTAAGAVPTPCGVYTRSQRLKNESMLASKENSWVSQALKHDPEEGGIDNLCIGVFFAVERSHLPCILVCYKCLS